MFLKVAIQWKEKDFQLSFWFYFHSKGQDVSVYMIFFESCNSMKMKTTFNCHFGFCFHTWLAMKTNLCNGLKDFQRHLGLFPNQHQPAPFLVIYFESRNSTKWKGLSAVILTSVFTAQASPNLRDRFWKSQFNEIKRTFTCQFGLNDLFWK